MKQATHKKQQHSACAVQKFKYERQPYFSP